MYDSRLLKKLIDLALDEDLAFGDPTSSFLPQGQLDNTGEIIAKEDLVVCGVGIPKLVLDAIDCNSNIKIHCNDGDTINKGTIITTITAPTSLLLSAERTILNFIQRLSGIATHVRKTIQSVPEIQLLDTRKTTPGWRVLEKYAVRVGGAKNHRLNLADLIMVKNNHLDASTEELNEYFSNISSCKPFYTPIQVEIRDAKELGKIAHFKPDALLLDNMTVEGIRECLEVLAEYTSWSPTIEISGRVRPENVDELKGLKIDAASSSFLMHGANPVDISLRLTW